MADNEQRTIHQEIAYHFLRILNGTREEAEESLRFLRENLPPAPGGYSIVAGEGEQALPSLLWPGLGFGIAVVTCFLAITFLRSTPWNDAIKTVCCLGLVICGWWGILIQVKRMALQKAPRRHTHRAR